MRSDLLQGLQLSMIPLRYVDRDITDDGNRLDPGHIEYLPSADARACVERKVAVVLAPVSVRRSGCGVHWDSQIAVIDFERARHLEAQGAVKILTTDADIQRHNAAWAEH